MLIVLIHVPLKIYPAYADFTSPHVNQLVVPLSYQVYNPCKHSIVNILYQDMEDLMKEVQEARRIKMLHQPSKVGR